MIPMCEFEVEAWLIARQEVVVLRALFLSEAHMSNASSSYVTFDAWCFGFTNDSWVPQLGSRRRCKNAVGF